MELLKDINEYLNRHQIGGSVNDYTEATTVIKEEYSRLDDLCTVGNYDLSFEEIDGLLAQRSEAGELIKKLASRFYDGKLSMNNAVGTMYTHERVSEIKIVDKEGNDCTDLFYKELVNYLYTDTKQLKDTQPFAHFGLYYDIPTREELFKKLDSIFAKIRLKERYIPRVNRLSWYDKRRRERQQVDILDVTTDTITVQCKTCDKIETIVFHDSEQLAVSIEEIKRGVNPFDYFEDGAGNTVTCYC